MVISDSEATMFDLVSSTLTMYHDSIERVSLSVNGRTVRARDYGRTLAGCGVGAYTTLSVMRHQMLGGSVFPEAKADLDDDDDK